MQLNDSGYIGNSDSKIKKELLNKTVDLDSRYRSGKNKSKLKGNFDMRSLSNQMHNINMEFMRTNIDRPKVMAVQDTLPGVLESNSAIKNKQRILQKMRHWGGIKIPIGKESLFNKRRDKISMWDEKRDGIFHEL